MKITVKEFQSQPFEVKTSNRNVQKALKIQLKMNEADDIADKSTEEVLKGRQEVLDSMKAFIVEILKLSPKQIDKYDDLDVYKEIPVIAAHLSGRLLGVPEDAFDESVKNAAQAKK